MKRYNLSNLAQTPVALDGDGGSQSELPSLLLDMLVSSYFVSCKKSVMNETTGKEKSWTHWFEIPVTDFNRAKKFYETVFDTQIHAMDFGGFKMGIFPHKETGAALCQGEWYKPSADGVVVYMDANPDLSVAQGKIETAGGKVIMPKKQISPEHGFMALFLDSEGNRVALHSDK